MLVKLNILHMSITGADAKAAPGWFKRRRYYRRRYYRRRWGRRRRGKKDVVVQDPEETENSVSDEGTRKLVSPFFQGICLEILSGGAKNEKGPLFP